MSADLSVRIDKEFADAAKEIASMCLSNNSSHRNII